MSYEQFVSEKQTREERKFRTGTSKQIVLNSTDNNARGNSDDLLPLCFYILIGFIRTKFILTELKVIKLLSSASLVSGVITGEMFALYKGS